MSVEKTIRAMVIRQCENLKVPFSKRLYRKVKEMYKTIPHNKKEDFYKYFTITK